MDKNFYLNLRALLKFLTNSLQLRFDLPSSIRSFHTFSSKDDIEKCSLVFIKKSKEQK